MGCSDTKAYELIYGCNNKTYSVISEQEIQAVLEHGREERQKVYRDLVMFGTAGFTEEGKHVPYELGVGFRTDLIQS